jgi:hypothetical protein
MSDDLNERERLVEEAQQNRAKSRWDKLKGAVKGAGAFGAFSGIMAKLKAAKAADANFNEGPMETKEGKGETGETGEKGASDEDVDSDVDASEFDSLWTDMDKLRVSIQKVGAAVAAAGEGTEGPIRGRGWSGESDDSEAAELGATGDAVSPGIASPSTITWKRGWGGGLGGASSVLSEETDEDLENSMTIVE